MKARRAVISGLGVVAPNGIGKTAFWQHLLAGESAVGRISAFDASHLPCTVAAEVRDFRPEQFMAPRRTKHRGRFSQFAVAAAKLALADGRLPVDTAPRPRIDVCVGTSVNGMGDVFEAAHHGFQQQGVRGFPAMAAIEYAAHAATSHISSELALGGQPLTLASGCTTGIDAIYFATRQVTSGVTDLAIAGATDAPIAPFSFAALCGLGVLTRYPGPPHASCRPYDRLRDGLVAGEGAAILLIEELEHAHARSAPIYAEVKGFGTGNEGAFPASPNAAQLALQTALKAALRSANLSVYDVDYISAHGNALPDYDLTETLALKEVFGARSYAIPTSSIKSMIGHAMAAASALQVAATSLCISQSLIPPTINLTHPDPQCDLDYVPHRSRHVRVRHALVNAHAMGGTHSVLVLAAPSS